MKKDPDHNSTNSAEIEALITRIERGQLRDEDAQLLARLLRLLLRLITLLQQKNASLSRLKLLLFGPRSDTRMKVNPSPTTGAEGESDSASSTSTEQTSSDTLKGALSQRFSCKGGHGRMGAEAYTGARLARCRDAELKPGASPSPTFPPKDSPPIASLRAWVERNLASLSLRGDNLLAVERICLHNAH